MAKKVDFLKSLKDMNDADLQAKITEDQMRLKKMQFAHAMTPVENPMSIRILRKDIARMKTELKRRQLSA
jgi:large subunit ribosomal protein L29